MLRSVFAWGRPRRCYRGESDVRGARWCARSAYTRMCMRTPGAAGICGSICPGRSASGTGDVLARMGAGADGYRISAGSTRVRSRERAGDWECDLVMGSPGTGNLVTLAEREAVHLTPVLCEDLFYRGKSTRHKGDGSLIREDRTSLPMGKVA
ncbi:MAG: hypothetical protein NTZ78_08485 [Candidatus Aureabacteria bacterium]|nr:hypothetical protein [Candidatus Auribacterota bacterium]